VVERGHNKQVVFAEESDYRYYLKTLEEFKDLYGVKVYGFCLMTNHQTSRNGVKTTPNFGQFAILTWSKRRVADLDAQPLSTWNLGTQPRELTA